MRAEFARNMECDRPRPQKRLVCKKLPVLGRVLSTGYCCARGRARSVSFALLSLLPFGVVIPLHAQTNSDGDLKLAPPLPELKPTFWEMHHWAVIIAAIIVLLLVAELIWTVLKPKPVVITPPETVAREALGKLAGKPEDGACLSRISQIVRHYFVVAFELPGAEMTTSEMTDVLATYNKHWIGTGQPGF